MTMWRLMFSVFALALLGLNVAAADAPRRGPHGLLAHARTWDYVINKAQPARIASVPSDLVVMDYSRWGDQITHFSPAVIGRLKHRADGSRRLVLAYLSVGEAEDYRYYWRWSWHLLPPAFVMAENCRWPGNHPVRYWDPRWQDILFRGPASYLERIQAVGFDGVYLDRVDAYGEFESKLAREAVAKPRDKMINLVAGLVAAARKHNPDFLVIAQNGEELLSSPRYRALIDGVAKEDLLFGLGGTGVRNKADDIAYSEHLLDLMKRAGKPVLVVEYLEHAEQVAESAAELRARGYVPVFPPRRLDGSDPLAPRPATADAKQAGTPEYAKTACGDGRG